MVSGPASYQAFCRRLNRLAPAFQALAEIWEEDAAEKRVDTHCYAVDSCPVMAARRSYSTGARVGAGFCDKCCNAARQEWYYGVKLHVFVMLRPGRLPLLRAAQISPASCPDLKAAKQLDRGCAPVPFGLLFADWAYCDADWADFLKNAEKFRSLRQEKENAMTSCVPETAPISTSVLHASPLKPFSIGLISNLPSGMPRAPALSWAPFSSSSPLSLLSPF